MGLFLFNCCHPEVIFTRLVKVDQIFVFHIQGTINIPEITFLKIRKTNLKHLHDAMSLHQVEFVEFFLQGPSM